MAGSVFELVQVSVRWVKGMIEYCTDVVLGTSDGEEALESLLVEAALGILGRFVGHEAVYEGVGGESYNVAGEGLV